MNNETNLRILGIDPGIAITGWGILDYCVKNNKITVISYGAVLTPSTQIVCERLETIYNDLTEIVKEFNPVVCAIEQLFFFKNAKTIITVGEARGVALLTAKMNNLEIFEYSPLQIKQAITGYGRASKDQIQKMVTSLLKLDEVPKPDDVADALAVAYTHSVFNPNLK